MYGPKAITVVHRDVPTWFAFFADWVNLGGTLPKRILEVSNCLSEPWKCLVWVNLGGAVSNATLYVALHQSVRDELRKLFRRRLNVVHVGGQHLALPIIRY